jgi:hypothetical protein
MSSITIPAHVADLLRSAVTATRLVDEQGNVLGSFSPEQPPNGLTPAEWAEIRRRQYAQGPRYTTQQVLDYLETGERP